MRKYDLISTLSEETIREVARSDGDWKKYLDTASRIYKYPFKDQLLIYAQRPDVTACASIEIWNEKMRCWVNWGAKGIALIDEEGSTHGGLRYVFDISDVHRARRIGRFPQLWEMREEHQEAVLGRLEQIYGDTSKEAGFTDRIRELALRIAKDCYKELASDMEYLKEGSFLEELDELNIGVRIRETLADSIAYTVLKRCGMDGAELSEEIEFPYIHEFNTVETLSHIGNSVSDLSKPVLMEIGKAIWAYDRERARNEASKNSVEKGLANTSEMRYNALKRESKKQEGQSIAQAGNAGERGNHNESDLREERGLSDPDVTDGRTAGGDTDKIRADEEELLTGTQEGRVHRASPERETERAPSGGPGAGRAEDGAPDRADDGAGRGDGEAQGREPDAVGAEDEQHQAVSGGGHTGGAGIQPISGNGTTENTDLQKPGETYQQLSLFPGIEEQIGTIEAAQAGEKHTMPAAFSLPREQLEAILRTGGGWDNSRSRIYAKYQQGKTPEEMAEFLKNEYRTTGKGFDFGDNPISVWFDERGMSIGYGMSAKENLVAVVSWQEAEGIVRSMVEDGSYMAANEAFLVDAVERQRVSNDLYHFFQDGIGEIPDGISVKGNYPDGMTRLCELLSSQEGRDRIAGELSKAKEQLDTGEKKIKWGYVKSPEHLLLEVADLSTEKKEYPALDNVEVLREDFITQDEIDARLTGGSSLHHGQFRIYEYFMEGHGKNENIAFLKNEYGTGGSSHALVGSDVGHEDHDAKGIRLEKGSYGNPYAKVLLAWNVVEKRISELIKEDKYLAPEGKEAYAQYKKEQAEKALQRGQEKLEHGVRIGCKKAIEKAIAEKFDGYTLPGDAAESVIKQFGKECVEYILANTITHLSHDGRFSPDNREWAKTLAPDAGWQTRDLIVTSHPAVLDGFTNQARGYLERDRELDKEDISELERETSGQNVQKPGPENTASDSERSFMERLAEMSAVAKICAALSLKDEVGWNEDTGEVAIQDADRRLEGQAAYGALFLEATDYVLTQSLSGNADKALEMDSLLKEAQKYAARYGEAGQQRGEKDADKASEAGRGEEKQTEDVAETGDGFPGIDTNAARERLAEAGIVDGQPVDGNALNNDPFIQQVTRGMETLAGETEKKPEKDPEKEPGTDKPAARNFHISYHEAETAGKGFAPKEKFRQNVEAIRTLEKIEGEHRTATPEEQEVLAKYVGWGGLADAFDATKANWANEYQELKGLLSPEEYASARESTLNAHYTSPVIIQAIYDAVGKMGFTKGNVLDPVAGIGNFYGGLPEEMQGSRLYGAELDGLTGRIAKQLYPHADIKITGFENTNYPNDFFDVAVGNVPFGQYKVADKAYDRHNFLIHDYFFGATRS